MDKCISVLSEDELLHVNGGDAGLIIGVISLLIAAAPAVYDFAQGWNAAKKDAQAN